MPMVIFMLMLLVMMKFTQVPTFFLLKPSDSHINFELHGVPNTQIPVSRTSLSTAWFTSKLPPAKYISCCLQVAKQCCARDSKIFVLRSCCRRRSAGDRFESRPLDCATSFCSCKRVHAARSDHSDTATAYLFHPGAAFFVYGRA